MAGQPARLEGPWGAVEVGFGRPARADWSIDVGLEQPVVVQAGGDRYLASEWGHRQRGLVERAVLAAHLAERGAVVLHAAAVADDHGRATLFLGRSGAGKTTISTQARGRLVGDDTVVLWPEGDDLLVVSTPFISERGRPAELDRARPTAVCTLAWGPRPFAERLAPKPLFEALLQSVYRPPDPRLVTGALGTLLRMSAGADGYRLTFPRDFRFRAQDLGALVRAAPAP